jgi:hypothetical protein
MRHLLLLLTISSLQAATIYVGTTCPANGGSCTYAATEVGLQAAIDAAKYGDIISIEAPETIIGAFTLPVKSCADLVAGVDVTPCDPWVTIQTSRWQELLEQSPRGTRVKRDHQYSDDSAASLMPKLQVTVGGVLFTGGPENTIGTVDVAADTITAAGFANGDAVTIQGSSISPFVCIADDDPAPSCDPGEEGYWIDRNSTNFPEAMPVYVHASAYAGNIPSEGWYYIKDAGASKYHLSATPNGTAIVTTSEASNALVNFELAPYPLRQDTVYWVRNLSGGAFQLSESPTGAIIDIQSTGYHSQNTSTWTANRILVSKAEKISGWRFRGIEFSQQPNAATISNVLILFNNVNNYYALSRYQIAERFEFDHVYGHGFYWQNGPVRVLRPGAQTAVKDSILIEAKSYSSGQSQAIYPVCNYGMLWVVNSALSGQGETFMADIAGCHVRDLRMQNFYFINSFLHRPIWWYPRMRTYKDSDTVLKVKTPGAGMLADSDCLTAYNGGDSAPSSRCASYLRDDEAYRYEINVDTYATFSADATGIWAFLHLWDGTFQLRHNLSAGSVVCTGGWSCVADASLSNTSTASWPTNAKGINKGSIATGVLATIAQNSANNVFFQNDTRNILETKTGDKMRVFGSLLRGCWYSSSAVGGGDLCVSLNPKLTGSNTTENYKYWSSANEIIFKNNYFRDGVSMIGASGDAPTIGREESWPFRLSTKHQIVNNIGIKFGTYYWGFDNSVAQANNRPFYMSAPNHWLLSHNTLIDVDQYSLYYVGSRYTDGHLITDNIFVARTRNATVPDGNHVTAWESLVFPAFATDGGELHWRGNASLTQETPGGTNLVPNSVLQRTIITNPTVTNNSAKYYASGHGYLTTASTSAADIHASFLTNGYRIPSGDYGPGGQYAPDGAMGADPDKIDAETGVLGADTAAGILPYYKRTFRSVSTTSSTISVVYKQVTASVSCTTTAYDNAFYISNGGTLTVTDSALPVNAYHKVTLTGASSNTRYYLKRECTNGGTVDGRDVFEAKTL